MATKLHVGDRVSTLVRVLTDPPLPRGTVAKVIAVSSDRQKLYLDANGVVFTLSRGDVFPLGR